MTGEPFHWANRSWFYPERTIPVGEFTRGLHDFAPRIPVRTDTTALTAARAAKLIAEAGGKAPRMRIGPSRAGNWRCFSRSVSIPSPARSIFTENTANCL